MVERNAMRKTNNIISVLLLAAMSCTLFSCGRTGGGINYNILPGNDLYLPEDGASRDLSDLGATMFYWTPSIAEDNGFVSYDVLFDRLSGDFSDPVYTVSSQFNGSRPYVELSAKELNRIARLAGVGVEEEGTVKWTVRASKGLYGAVYSGVHTINVRTMYSIDPLPQTLYLSGPAIKDAEGVDRIMMTNSRGIDKADAGEGIFESFCKIASGRDLFISDESGRSFVLNASGSVSVCEQPLASRLSSGNGVIWLTADMDGMTWSYKTLESVYLYAAAWADGNMSTANEAMRYAGSGVYELRGYDNKTSKNSANDSRYRFNAVLGDGSRLYIGTEATLGAEYTVNYRILNFYTNATIGNVDWDKTFNLVEKDCGVPCDVFLYLNSDNEAGTFWHEFVF